MTDDTPRPTMEAARPAGPVTTMHIVLDGEPVIATRIPAASLEGHLDGAEADIVRLGRTRADVADQVRSAFESGSWRTPKIRAALARAMLWLALRGDASLAERARKTPMTLVWHVIQRPGVWNLVLHPGDTPDRAAMPAEAPPDVGAAGDPAPGERGHGPKIAAAVAELEKAGTLPAGLRPKERLRRVLGELARQGLAKGELPSRRAIDRWFARRRLH